MIRSKQAAELFKKGYSCAQSILIAYSEEVGLDSQTAFSIAAGLGGGIGKRQHICGAINAGAMVLGLKFGNYSINDKKLKDNLSDLVGSFVDDCEFKLGGSQCLELIKIDLKNDELRHYASDCGFFDKVCTNAVEQTAIILEKYLQKNI